MKRLTLPLLIWGWVYFDSIVGMVTVWNQSKTYEHGFLIIPISLWIVWNEKEKFQQFRLSTAWLPCIGLIFPALLWLIGNIAGIAFFEHLAAVISLQLILWSLLGNQLAKAYFFPILYLLFCVPFGEELVPYLQSFTADISVIAVQWTGIPIYREGLFLTIPNGKFEVAEACSGIRFLISSIALGSLFAYLFFSTWWKSGLFVLFSCLFPIIANGIRAYGIIIIGHLSDMTLATGADHLIYGWVFFSLIILLMFFTALRFSDKPLASSKAKLATETLSSQTSSHDSQTVKATNKAESSSMVLVVSVLLMAILISASQWSKWITTGETLVAAANVIPEQTSAINSSEWGITYPKAQLKTHVVAHKTQTEYFVARYALNQLDGELVSYENQLFNKNYWSINSSKDLLLVDNETNIKIKYIQIINYLGEPMNVVYWHCINNYCSNSRIKLKLYKAYQLIIGNGGYSDIHAIASKKLSQNQLLVLAQNWLANDAKKK
ncbi:exosortase A [Vibrio sp. TH_r3]|uniref:exosortase A n=1 Tax=Vibrio sp. TH_r3 TaxID=3082084 RepID=UPI0029544A2B|nr:exosortase A [Vibrio sp. TH_r3]MDV7102898.1 exosortase A [Vibrio sp. TH_r3]